MQALILAAGRGSRLGLKSDGTPKCLLEVGRRPLIDHQLEALAEAGIGPVGMVLGYCADEIREIVGIRAEYIVNQRWAVTNSLYSFWLAKDWVQGPVMVINSDVLFHPEILERLLAAGSDAIAYDSSSGHGLENMKVSVDDGKLVTMRKDLDASEVSGENVGIVYLSADSAKELFSMAGGMMPEPGEKQWLGSVLALLAARHCVQAIDIAGLPWGEADFAYDLDRLRKEVFPAIRRSRRKPRVGNWVRWAAAASLIATVTGFIGLSDTPSTPVLAKETLEIVGSEEVQLTADDRVARWSLIQQDDWVEYRIKGPRTLEIESRVVIPTNCLTPIPYVLELSQDDERIGWFKEVSTKSLTWKSSEFTVGKICQVHHDLPAGLHHLRVRLVAAESRKCLVRTRVLVPDQDKD